MENTGDKERNPMKHSADQSNKMKKDSSKHGSQDREQSRDRDQDNQPVFRRDQDEDRGHSRPDEHPRHPQDEHSGRGPSQQHKYRRRANVTGGLALPIILLRRRASSQVNFWTFRSNPVIWESS